MKKVYVNIYLNKTMDPNNLITSKVFDCKKRAKKVGKCFKHLYVTTVKIEVECWM